MAVDYLSALNVEAGSIPLKSSTHWSKPSVRQRRSEINSAKEKRTVEISSLGQIKQGFETFDNSLTPVKEITGLSVASGGTSIDVKISDAKTGNKIRSLHCHTSVAAGQTLVFDGYSSETASTGTGKLTFSFGKWNSDNSFTANSSDRSNVAVTLATGAGHTCGPSRCSNSANMSVTASL